MSGFSRIAIVALFAVAGSATSAGAQGFNWNGFYVGVNAGYGWGEADTAISATSTERVRVFRAFGLPAETLITDVTNPAVTESVSRSVDMNGWLGGAQLGYIWRSGQIVYGLEADIQASGQDGRFSVCSTAACAIDDSFANGRFELNWFGTLRARVGILLQPQLLLYATGGFAYGGFDAKYTAGVVGDFSISRSDSSTATGWVVGGGVETALDRNWLLRAEYLYMDLGGVARVTGGGASQDIAPDTPMQGFTTVTDLVGNATIRTDFTSHILRLGLSYKFN